MALKIWIAEALTNVTINIGTQSSADGNGDITVFAWTTGNVNVDTNVTVQFLWTGLGNPASSINSNVIIYSGTDCSGGISIGGALANEGTNSIYLASLTPTYSATQNYLQGSGTYPVTTCP